MPFLLSLLAVLGLAFVHLFSERLRSLDGTPRARWLSWAGGVSVAYVFVHLLPELAEAQEVVAESLEEGLGFLQNHAYLMALLGLVIFYGLERAAVTSRRRGGASIEEASTSPGVFWLHMASFALYNAVIGYLLVVRGERDPVGLLVFFAAMAVHLLINDRGLREHHKDAYRRIGRWLLAGALVLGWAASLTFELPEVTINLLIAFLGGGIVLNVLKEELPKERESRFPAFALGAAAYSVLLLLL